MHYCALIYVIISFFLFLASTIGIAYERKEGDNTIVAIFMGVLMCIWALISSALLIFG